MTRAARSVFLFGFYPTLVGVAHLAVPDLMLRASGMPPTDLLWLRLLGMLLVIVGTFYILAGRAGLEPFFPWTLFTRCGSGAVLVVMVLTGAAPLQCLWFWAVDGVGAVWTWLALRADRADRGGRLEPAGVPAPSGDTA
jgi:hypothetical protein